MEALKIYWQSGRRHRGEITLRKGNGFEITLTRLQLHRWRCGGLRFRKYTNGSNKRDGGLTISKGQ